MHACSIRKLPSQASVAGWWVDLSMATGNPNPNYYLGPQFTATTLEADKGIFHGDDKAPAKKFLRSLCLMTPTAGLVGMYQLLDYLMFYGSIELDNADQQDMDNTVTLPRYADGDGVRAMLVATTPTVGLGTFEYDYINQDGIARTSPVISLSTVSANIASLPTSQPNTAAGGEVFLRLADGDTGIRAVTGLRNLTLDGGLASIVLVKPLAALTIREINTPDETEWIRQDINVPQIEDGAYLNLIMNCAATVAAGTLAGFAKFTWL